MKAQRERGSATECRLPFESAAQDICQLRTAITDPAQGCPPLLRDLKTHIDLGIINLNKPAGPSSHQVADYVKKILGLEKVGHGGTLEPRTATKA